MTDAEVAEILRRRLHQVRSRMEAACRRVGRDPADVRLVAVTKSVSPRVASLLPAFGVSDLGESRPQELWRKAAALAERSIHWHQIGHLQRNKVERTVPLTACIHSVDRVPLLESISEIAGRLGKRVRILLQVNVSREVQKHGFAPEEVAGVVERFGADPNLEIAGLMGMAAYADDPEQARPAFRELRLVRDRLAQTQLDPTRRFDELSMGMSGDFEVAIEEGATMVRIGSTLFEGLENE